MHDADVLMDLWRNIHRQHNASVRDLNDLDAQKSHQFIVACSRDECVSIHYYLSEFLARFNADATCFGEVPPTVFFEASV